MTLLQLLLCSYTLHTFSAAGVVAFPTPSRQTKAQYELFVRAQSHASAASAAAVSEVLEAFSDQEFRSGLRACCPAIAQLSARSLLEYYHAQTDVAELVHDFDAVINSTHGPANADVDLKLAQKSTYQYNLWELQYLGLRPPQNGTHSPENYAEVNLLGFKPFSKGNAPSSFAEASDRPLYVGLNQRAIDVGLPAFGTVSVILKRSYVSNMTIITPTDTGLWTFSCGPKSVQSDDVAMPGPPSPSWRTGFRRDINCSSWQPAGPTGLATLDHYNHLILANAWAWAEETGGFANALVNVFARMTHSLEYPLSASVFPMHFWESDIAGNILYPEGVSFLIGNFRELFGTGTGRQLQRWAKEQGWVLTWAFGSYANGTKIGYGRALDLEVLPWTSAGHNVTVGTGLTRAYANLWEEARELHKGGEIEEASWLALWTKVRSLPEVPVEPLRAGECSQPDNCIGINKINSACICYASS